MQNARKHVSNADSDDEQHESNHKNRQIQPNVNHAANSSDIPSIISEINDEES